MTTYPGALLVTLRAPPKARVASRRRAGLITAARDAERDGLAATEWRNVLTVREGLVVREGLSVRMGLLYVGPSRPGLRLRGLPVYRAGLVIPCTELDPRMGDTNRPGDALPYRALICWALPSGWLREAMHTKVLGLARHRQPTRMALQQVAAARPPSPRHNSDGRTSRRTLAR